MSTGLLDGKELDKKLGDLGSLSIDVTKEGKIIAEVVVSYEEAGLKASSKNSVEVELFVVLEKVCAKNNITWDEALLSQLKAILGIVG